MVVGGCSTVWPFDTVVGGCVLTPPLCPGESVFCLVFFLVLGFGFVFRWVLGVVWYCSATGLLLFCLNDFYGGPYGRGVLLESSFTCVMGFDGAQVNPYITSKLSVRSVYISCLKYLKLIDDCRNNIS